MADLYLFCFVSQNAFSQIKTFTVKLGNVTSGDKPIKILSFWTFPFDTFGGTGVFVNMCSLHSLSATKLVSHFCPSACNIKTDQILRRRRIFFLPDVTSMRKCYGPM